MFSLDSRELKRGRRPLTCAGGNGSRRRGAVTAPTPAPFATTAPFFHSYGRRREAEEQRYPLEAVSKTETCYRSIADHVTGTKLQRFKLEQDGM